jgi:Zn-dependent protease
LLGLTPATIITRIIVFLVAVSVHEFAHAYVAYRMGDPTAKEQGRMTLDPRANIYPIGFIIGVLFGLAIMGSAPVNSYRMRNPRTGMLLAVLAGPVSNLLVAAVFAIPFQLFPGLVVPAQASPCLLGQGSLLGCAFHTPAHIMYEMVFLNVILFVFNLLPLFPLDGWTVMLSVLPSRQAIWWERNRQNSMFVLIGLFVLSFLAGDLARISSSLIYLDILNWLIIGPSNFIVGILIG